MPRPTFADPKTDFIFKRIFGSEPHKHLLTFEIARIAQLSEAEYEYYEKQKMAEQDGRGMLIKAREEGHAEGAEKTSRKHIRAFCEATEIGWDDERQRHVDALSLDGLEDLWERLLRDRRWPEP